MDTHVRSSFPWHSCLSAHGHTGPLFHPLFLFFEMERELVQMDLKPQVPELPMGPGACWSPREVCRCEVKTCLNVRNWGETQENPSFPCPSLPPSLLGAPGPAEVPKEPLLGPWLQGLGLQVMAAVAGGQRTHLIITGPEGPWETVVCRDHLGISSTVAPGQVQEHRGAFMFPLHLWGAPS